MEPVNLHNPEVSAQIIREHFSNGDGIVEAVQYLEARFPEELTHRTRLMPMGFPEDFPVVVSSLSDDLAALCTKSDKVDGQEVYPEEVDYCGHKAQRKDIYSPIVAMGVKRQLSNISMASAEKGFDGFLVDTLMQVMRALYEVAPEISAYDKVSSPEGRGR